MSSLSDARRHGAFPSRTRRRVLTGAVVLATAAGLAPGFAEAPVGGEPGFVLLLRFMAALKIATALGAAGLTWWRLGYPMDARRVVSAIGASAAMAFGAGVLWGMAHLVAGAVLFHAALLGWLVLCYADRSAIGAALASVVARRSLRQRRSAGATGTATSLRRNGGRVQGGS